jgi:hypothetical protein
MIVHVSHNIGACSCMIVTTMTIETECVCPGIPVLGGLLLISNEWWRFPDYSVIYIEVI